MEFGSMIYHNKYKFLVIFFSIIGFSTFASSSHDEHSLLAKAYTAIINSPNDQEKIEKLDVIISHLVDNCSSANELLELGKTIFYDFYDEERAKNKVLYFLSDHVIECSFSNLDDLIPHLELMGFEGIIAEINQKNEKCKGARWERNETNWF